MNALLDDIKVLICGGNGVGKTTLVKRLAFAFSSGNTGHHTETILTNATITRFDISLNISSPVPEREEGQSSSSAEDKKLTMRLKLLDVGGEVVNSKGKELDQLINVVKYVEGVIIVVDVSNALSLKDSDVWLEFLSQNAPKAAFRFLVVHKADLPLSERVITARNLDLFVNQSDIVDWGYTVGHPDLIDADTRRGGPWGKQTCIETIIERLIVHVTQRRRYNFYKILPTPLKIHFFDSKELEYTNLSEFLELDENQDK